MLMWLCAIVGTALVVGLAYYGIKFYGAWAMRRDEAERAALQEVWKKRQAERRAREEGAHGGGRAPAAEADERDPLDS